MWVGQGAGEILGARVKPLPKESQNVSEGRGGGGGGGKEKKANNEERNLKRQETLLFWHLLSNEGFVFLLCLVVLLFAVDQGSIPAQHRENKKARKHL